MISKDELLLAEAYQQVIEKAKGCSHAKSPENCDCDNCDDCKKNQKIEEGKNVKPDYLDADDDGNTDESMKKALKDKKNKGNFKALHKKTMSSSKK